MGKKHTQTAATTSTVITEEGEVWSPPKLLPPGEAAAHSFCWVWDSARLLSSATLSPLTAVVDTPKLQYQWQHPVGAWAPAKSLWELLCCQYRDCCCTSARSDSRVVTHNQNPSGDKDSYGALRPPF